MDRCNIELAVEKKLIVDNNDDKYQKLVNIYKYLLEYYLSTIIDFKKYDDLIKNSDLYIGINNKYKDLNLFLDLNYIFLINRLFVEKLDINDIDILINKFDKNNISDELIEIIKRTYKMVIYDNYLDGKYQDIIYKVCYGSFIPTNMVSNDSLVLKIYYGKNLIDLNGKEFVDLHQKQLSFINDIMDKIKEDVKNKLDLNCDILLTKDIY